MKLALATQRSMQFYFKYISDVISIFISTTKWIVMWGVAEIMLVHDGSGREENVKMMEFSCDACISTVGHF